MKMHDVTSTPLGGLKHFEGVTVALVSKCAPEGIGGLEHHLDMLLSHVPDPSCTYLLVTGSAGDADRGGRVRAYLRFVRRLMRCRSDLLHFQGFDRLQILTLLLITRGRIPLVVTPHNGLAGIVNDRSAMRRFAKRWADGLLFPALVRRGARIIALSAQERDYYLGRFPRSRHLVDVLPNPVAGQDWAPLPSGPPRLLVLARLSPAKHIEDLISAMALLPPDVECDIAGPDCGAAAALQDQALQVGRTIRFHGAVQGAEKDRLFDAAAMVVVTTEAEGLSTVALEALARGIPVIASEGGSRGLPAEGVYQYRFGSASALAAAIQDVLPEANLVKARHSARRASSALIGYDDYARALRSVYRSGVEWHRNRVTPGASEHRRRLRTSPKERRPA